MTYPSLFDEKRTAQAAAFLLNRAGGQLHVLKLMKLMYLSERESLRKYGDTITGDSFVSMQNGPVLSMMLNMLNGFVKTTQDGWDRWISDRAEHLVELNTERRAANFEDTLDALSESDVECLDAVWRQFGHMSRWKLVEYTHSDACPEWENPGNSSRPIPMSRVLKAVGYKPEEVEALTKRLHGQQQISAAFG
jgi:uncharacterized phage-associated protein